VAPANALASAARKAIEFGQFGGDSISDAVAGMEINLNLTHMRAETLVYLRPLCDKWPLYIALHSELIERLG
jgi:hypothetical protein